MDGNGDDPFDSLTKLCVLSDSQEDILRRCSFAGNPESVDGSCSTNSQIHHHLLQPTGVFMAPLPESLEQREQITSHNAYQAPPKQSGGQRPMAGDDPSLQDAAVVAGGAEAAVEGGCVRDVATAVDLGKNDDLGFRLEVQSTQQTDEIEIIGVHRRKVSESDAGGERESASKRLNFSNEALGTDSSVPIVVEKLPVDLESGGGSKLVDHNVEMAEESATVAVESGKVDDGKVSNGEETHCNKNKEKFAENRVENSQPEEPCNYEGTMYRDRWRCVLPSTMNGSKNSEETDATPPSIIMEILKLLAEEEGEEDKELASMSILEVVSRRGMTFPRPCWWPEGQEFSFKKKS